MNEKKSTNQLFQVEERHLQGLWGNKRFEQPNQGSQDDQSTGRRADTSSCTTLQVKNLHLLLTTMKPSKDFTLERESSLVVQGLRIHLPGQGAQVEALSRKTPHTDEQLSPCTANTEPERLEPCAAMRSAGSTVRRACSAQLEKALAQQ